MQAAETTETTETTEAILAIEVAIDYAPIETMERIETTVDWKRSKIQSMRESGSAPGTA
jgi:hypothetical protein